MSSNTSDVSASSSSVVDKLEPDVNKLLLPPEAHPSPPPETCYQTMERLSTKEKLVNGWWSAELASLILSFVVFSIYCGFLEFYNRRVIHGHHWYEHRFSPFKNPPSAAGQIITTLKLFMAYPVAAAMGQLKWHHFIQSKAKPVADLQSFDAASRGVAGSLKLLYSKNRFCSINISLGCLFFIATLLLSSMAQNPLKQGGTAVRWYEESPPSSVASLLVSDMYNHATEYKPTGSDRRYWDADPGMRAAIFAAWSYYFQPKEIISNNFFPNNCSKVYCQWQNVTSLDVEFECEPVSAGIDSDGFMYSAQGNITSRVEPAGTNSSSTYMPARLRVKSSPTIPGNSTFRKSYADNPGLIVHLAAIAELGPQRKLEAVECILYWQLRTDSNITYDAITNSGNLTIGEFSTNTNPTVELLENGEKNIVFEGPCNPTKNHDKNTNSTCSYTVSAAANLGLQTFLGHFLTGHLYQNETETGAGVPSNRIVMGLLETTWVYISENSTDQPLYATLRANLQNMALCMLENIRLSSAKTVSGKLGTKSYYTVNWIWVMYPGAMLALSTYLFFFAVWRTREMPTWKNSLLPFLYHGFEHPVLDQGGDFSNLAWMEVASKRREVVLRDGADGLGLKLRDSNMSRPVG